MQVAFPNNRIDAVNALRGFYPSLFYRLSSRTLWIIIILLSLGAGRHLLAGDGYVITIEQ